MYLHDKYNIWRSRLTRFNNMCSGESTSDVISEIFYRLRKRTRQLDGKLMKVFFEVTSRCNSRCVSCKIYERPPTDELSLSEIEKIFKSECMKNLGYIDLTGGEPFLRNDLADIANMAHSLTGCDVGITTNCLLPKKIYESVKRMRPKPDMNISLNGRKEMHDFTRGIKGNYEKVLVTRELLWSLGLNPGISFCLTPYNVDEIPWIYELANRWGTGVTVCLALPEPRLKAGKLGLSDYTEEQKSRILKQLKPGMYRDIVERYLSDSLWFTCQAGRRILHISSNGDIFPCHDTDPEWKNMGNVRKKSLDEIMQSPATKEMIGRISNFECQPCKMSVCFVTTTLWCGGSLLTPRESARSLV